MKKDASPVKRTVRYFVSYAHADGKLPPSLLTELKKQLDCCSGYDFQRWQDTQILVGEKWHAEIQAGLASCDFGLLLVSPSFLGSKYIGKHELPQFVAGEKLCMPVALCPIDFDNQDLKGLGTNQIFRFSPPRAVQPKTFGDCTAANHKRDFAHELFRQIVARLDKVFATDTTKPASSASPKKKTRKPVAIAPDTGTLLHRYFANLRAQFADYENLGLPIPDRDVKEGENDKPIPIRRLFVAPACTEAHFRPEAFDAALREGKNPAEPLLPRLAPAKSRTVLLADPGMGKSTLIQWLISTLAEEAVPPDAQELRGAIPLPFILRDLVGHLPQEVKGWNWDALVDAFRQWRHRGKGAPLAAPLTADDALFRSILASPDAFFLIDGLDEIGDPQRRLAIRDAIWEGFEKYPNARWLITSRIVGYEQAEVDSKRIAEWDTLRNLSPEEAKLLRQSLLDVGIPEDRVMPFGPGATKPTWLALQLATLLHLAPFDDPQQLAFARNWYVPRLGDAAGTQRADDFIAAVHRNDHTRVISRVPNLLYLLALLFRHRARLPDGRALVYAAISSAYLADIDLGRHLPDTLIVPWKFEEKEDLLALVAMRMQELRVAQTKDAKDAEDRMGEGERMFRKDFGDGKDARGEILVTRAQLEEWLGPRFGGAGDAAACAALHRFLDHIANRSGLLLPRGEGVFSFAHLSFQEYYAACFLEKEFQRILTQKAQPAGDDIFGTPSAAAKKDEEKMFAGMAALPEWREPLLFLVEKLRHSAPYTARILAWTFPQLATEQKPRSKDKPGFEEWMPITAAQLLAGISLDQEITLDDSQRTKIWRRLWQADIAAWIPQWMIGSSLIVAGSPYQYPVFEAVASLDPDKLNLIGCKAVSDLKALTGMASLKALLLNGCTAVRELNQLSGLGSLQRLSLYNCIAVSDLKPLAGLASLSALFLASCTAVSDLKPLAGLASLNELDLSGCTAVSNLKPLMGLASLKRLFLTNCKAVSDLKPLAGLASLSTLFLAGCTAVSDLKPLAGLASLNELYLVGCTAVSDEAVAALKASLPNLKIHR